MDKSPPTTATPPRNPWRSWIPSVVAGLVVVAAAMARFHDLGRRSLWFDEGVTLGMVRLPFDQFVRHAWDTNLNNQVLNYLVLRPWHLFGESEAALRSLSVLFSIGGVAATIAVGHRLFGVGAGIVAGLVLAFNPFEIMQAQQARGYGLAVFLSTLSVAFLVRCIERKSGRDVAGWAAACSLAMYAHFFSLLVVGAQVVSLAALGYRELRQRKSLLWGLLVIGGFSLPILIYGILVPKGFVSWIAPVELPLIIGIAAEFSGGRGWLLVPYLAFFAVLIAGLFRRPDPIRRWQITLLVLWASLPLLVLTAISQFQPILLPRYVVMSIPAWAILAGSVLGPMVGRRRIASAGVALVLAPMIASEVSELMKTYGVEFEDWRAPAAQVAAAARPGDVIVYNSSWAGLTFEYYLDRWPTRPESLQRNLLLPDESQFDVGQLSRRERVWLVLSRENSFQDMLPALRRSHRIVSGADYGFAKVVLCGSLQRDQSARDSDTDRQR